MIEDHLGNEFETVIDMSNYWNVDYSTLRYRLKKGWSIEKSLTRDPYEAIDHVGNHYVNKKEMCKHYGISYSTFINRIKRGWSLEETLTKKSQMGNVIKDHLGNVYRTKEEMSKKYGLATHTITKRLESGMSLEAALTTPHYEAGNRRIECEDHLGNKFISQKELCNYWNVNIRTFRTRIDSGWTLEEALTIKAYFKSYEYKGWKFLEQVYESSEGVVYYLCRKHNNEEVLSKEEIEEM